MNLANKMESSGRPGMVHISEKTHAFIKDEYFVEDGDPIQGRTTGTQNNITFCQTPSSQMNLKHRV